MENWVRRMKESPGIAVYGTIGHAPFFLMSKFAGLCRALSINLSGALLVKERIPTLPDPPSTKPVLLFDFNNILLRTKFSPRSLDFVSYKRAFCEEFLFNAMKNYEVIGISENHKASAIALLDELDPFGCISYRIFLKSKPEFDVDNLNRPMNKLVVLSTKEGEFNENFRPCVVRVPRWDAKPDKELFTILHFLNTLYYRKVEDFRPKIASYRGRDFYEAFKIQQKANFRNRHLFSTKDFDCELNKINDGKVEEYKKARVSMMKDKKKTESSLGMRALTVIKRIILS